MNAPAEIQSMPGAVAFFNALERMVVGNSQTIETAVSKLCGEMAAMRQGMTATTIQTPGAGAACQIGKDCKGTCNDCKSKDYPMLGAYGDSWSTLVTTMQAKGCNLICRPLSPCFRWALQMMLTRVSLRRLYWMLEHDDDSAEINTFCGDATDFVDISTTALTNNQKSLLAMTPAQVLPLIPAVSKASAVWEGDPVLSGVQLTLFLGPKNLTGLKFADLQTTLVQLGQPKNLARWFCPAPDGANGNCFIRPYPPFLGCSGGIVMDTESIYLLIETNGQLGNNQLKALPFEVIKAGTSDADRYCKQCETRVDDFGVPTQIPSKLM